jgi:hypothetical protein
MVLLRSGEADPGGGAVIGVTQLGELSRRWYGDRLDDDWRPRTLAQSQAILDEVGLTGPFWRLGQG